MIEFVTILASTIAILTLFLYFGSVSKRDPRFIFRPQNPFSKSGSFLLKPEGRFAIAISTSRNEKVNIEKVAISSENSSKMKIQALPEYEIKFSPTSNTVQVFWTGEKEIKRNHFIAFTFGYRVIDQDLENPVQINIEVEGRISVSNWGFPYSMFSRNTKSSTFTFGLNYCPNLKEELKEGIVVGPKEYLGFFGEASQKEFVAYGKTIDVKTTEFFKDRSYKEQRIRNKEENT